jgi:hypothetical protein
VRRTGSNRASFDHRVGAQQERFRDCEAERLGGRQIDDQIEFCRLLDRDVGRLRPTQNLERLANVSDGSIASV